MPGMDSYLVVVAAKHIYMFQRAKSSEPHDDVCIRADFASFYSMLSIGLASVIFPIMTDNSSPIIGLSGLV